MGEWNTHVITHSNPEVVGMVTREGEPLKQLQDAMTKANGLYNTGIIVSPASKKLVLSMYCPVFDDDESLMTTEVKDEMLLSILDSLKNDPSATSGDREYTDDTVGKSIAAYQYISEHGWVVVSHDSEDNIYADAYNVSKSTALKTIKFQIQVAKNKKFTKGLIKGNCAPKYESWYKIATKYTKQIKKLKKKGTYYVRVRAYAKYDEKKYYSQWSKVKKVKSF